MKGLPKRGNIAQWQITKKIGKLAARNAQMFFRENTFSSHEIAEAERISLRLKFPRMRDAGLRDAVLKIARGSRRNSLRRKKHTSPNMVSLIGPIQELNPATLWTPT
jgi:hypothetical protein